MVGFEILVRIEAGKRQEFLNAFRLLTRLDKREKACLSQRLFEELDKPNCFLWVEYWNALEALEVYLAGERFRTLLGAIDVLGLLETLRILEFKKIEDGS